MHLNGRNCCAVYSKSRVVDSAFPARSAPIFRGYPSPSAVQPAPPKGKPLAYRAGPAEHTGLFCVNVRALSSLADISSSKAWSMNFALHSFAVRFFFSNAVLIQPLRQCYALPPLLVGEALAVHNACLVSPEALLPGELSSVSETERLYEGSSKRRTFN